MDITARTNTALRDLGYLAGVLVWSIVGFTIWVTGVAVTASVLVLVVGVFVWIAFAYGMRWTTSVDRRMATWLEGAPIEVEYRESPPGLMARLKTITTDPQTWREFGWLALNSVVGFTLGVVALTATGVVIAYVTMPLWFWAINDPHTQYGLTNVGVFTVDTLPEALAVAVAGVVLIPAAVLLVRGAAAGHAQLVGRVLRSGSRRAARSLSSWS